MYIYTFAKKCFALGLLFTGISFAANAQNYTLIDGRTATGFPTNHTDEFFATVHIKNNTEDTLQLYWELLENEFSEEKWENITFCDPYICHNGIPQSFNPPLLPKETNVLKLGATPKTSANVAFMSIKIWEEGSAIVDTVTLTLDARTLGVIAISCPGPEVMQLYPNPAKNILNLNIENTGNNRVEIFTISGQKMLSTQLSRSNQVNIETLPAGLYTLRFVDRNGIVRVNKFHKI